MDYTINNYRAKKIDGKYFVTTDHGSFCVLDDDEFRKLKQNNIKDDLRRKLEEREIVLTNNNISEAIRLQKNRDNFLFRGTSLHIIVTTLRCNMNCIYCHASSKNENESKYDMDLDTAKKTVDFIFQTTSDNITIEFQGGEPLLNWNIIKYITKYAKEKNKILKKRLNLTLVTNFTTMDREKMQFIINEGICVCTSLDGPKELHDQNRKYKSESNYESVIYWIREFKKEYEKIDSRNEINALVTITKASLKFPREIVDEYVKNKLKIIHLRFLNNLGYAHKLWNEIGYTSDQFITFWKEAVEYISDLNKNGIKIEERMVQIMIQKISSEFDPNFLDLRSPCGAAIGQLTYNYDGNIYTCDEGRMIGEDLFKLGNVKTDTYKDIVTCDKACAVINASLNDQYYCDNCVYKPYCGVCPVCNYAEQGNIIGKICQTERCKIYFEQFNWLVKEKYINSRT
ncbi:His-Xaa-Ser system radical SAM maturase HxsB [Candidatus Woesearchaeota archaeon]|nr:His-Xaa-Ser system radical SAM maturase HxsB [Candidatus Woesearchaeota archaeon]